MGLADQGPITPRRPYRRWNHAPRDSWDAERIAAAMAEWARETGSPPLSYEWCPSTLRAAGRAGEELTKWEREHPRWPGSTTVYRYFDAWADALVAAGLPPGQRNPKRPLADRVGLALALHRDGAKVEAIADALGVTRATAATYLTARPCEVCGGPVIRGGDLCHPCATRRANPRRWSEEEVLAAVAEWVRTEGRAPVQSDWAPAADPESRWRKEFPRWPPASVARILFGGWARMLEAAGMEPNKHYWTKDEILAAIREHVRRTGSPPSKSRWEYGAPGRPSAKTVRMALGTFTAGVRAAGFEPARKRWPPERLARAFAAFEAGHGRPPTTGDWQRSGPDNPSQATVFNHFPSWAAAIEAGRRSAETDR